MYGYIIAAVVLVAALGGAYIQGRTDGASGVRVEWAEAREAQAAAVEADRKGQEAKARKLSARYESRIATQTQTNREITDALEKALGKANLPASCNLTDGLLDAWNAANSGKSDAAGKLPDASGSPAGAKVEVH